MEIVDIIILVMVLITAWLGYQKGLLIELLSLIAIVFAFAIAWKMSHQLVLYIHEWLDWNLKILGFIAFAAILLLVFYASYLVSKLLTGVLHKTFFGVFDKILGALMSALKWLFALSLLLWVLNTAKVEWYGKQKEKSIALSFCEKIAPTIFDWVRVAVPFEDVFGQIKKSIE
jgi:membrane protein required for colicin V production